MAANVQEGPQWSPSLVFPPGTALPHLYQIPVEQKKKKRNVSKGIEGPFEKLQLPF